MKFRTIVELGGKTATGFEVPAKVVTSLGSSKRPPVRVTINGYTYRSTVAPMGGRFLLPLNAENRAGAGVAAGEKIEVEIELDTEPRVVTEPADFKRALDRDPKARRRFDALAYSHRKEHVRAIEEAKTDVTRQRRIAKAISTLREEA